MQNRPALSVLVPLQEHECFDDTLSALARQQGVSHKEYEVVAVDSLYLRDWPPLVDAIQQRHPELSIRFEQIETTRSRARQLNVAVRLAQAPVLLMLADDFVPGRNLVSQHLQVHREDTSEDLVAMGPGLFPQDGRSNEFMYWLEDSGELFGVSFTRPGFRLPPHYFYMANTSLKRAFLQRAGEFDERFPYDAMDDWEMGLRLISLGMNNLYLPHAVATHEHIIDLPERCRAMAQAGESSAIYDSVHPRPGPWAQILRQARPRHAQRRRETREQRYRRLLRDHWVKGYHSFR
jgi:hypothetical protein